MPVEAFLQCPPTDSALASPKRRSQERRLPRTQVRVDGVWLKPNLEDWRPADVVLFSSEAKIAGSAQTALVRALQSREVGDPRHARWTHIGIYDGAGSIWDANPWANVARRPLKQVIARPRLLYVRRLRGLAVTRRALFDAVRAHSSAKYDFFPILAERIAPDAEQSEDHSRAACSVFVNRVLVQLARRRLFTDLTYPTPASFAVSSLFEDVPAQWRRA